MGKLDNVNICIAGGGTGGHLSIVKALASACKDLNIKCIYIGSTMGQDKAWFGKDSLDNALFSQTYFLDSKPVVGRNIIKKLINLLFILKASLQARKILKQEKVSHVISVGGFSSAPASFGAFMYKCPLFLHEQNSILGQANSVLAKKALAIFSSFPLKVADKEVLQTSYPVKGAFFDKARTRESIDSILFAGGSQGAKAINDLALKLAPLLDSKGIKIVHQTGKLDCERVKQAYLDLDIKASVFDFSNDMPKLMASTDFAISRSGASTLWELSATGLPALFVPYPFAAKNHQFFNAKFLESKSLCLLYTQDDLEEKSPKALLDEILAFPLKEASSKLQTLIHKDGTKEIIEKMLEYKKA
ncbi:UDP-N-acetylglucosamine--N-acetylmuramyl-(pentapeptide) pyrophosphoryl-undecaprenol N-acetylglucosamine transferase [Helicobacter sp. 11S02629-2]|uniref:UDP-N-acetylglucosamine--N-acetylmuramyl- (pentapeptide) pyrophosphoryl-undecaprenol N-acetylglucosamine transferase n=1 Tax=Helicobacter sp. 11S02629-2 TaxID=1476195 RepID=UPI000BA72CEA|nr:UDP-N-acetylglucosamine--N-acetylmuramyl-(pentapeptide) pyrophosphoryl-undecaprenol N-acetylglucosamine transferase [Helicobacter sp. 11S02629-2]PAF44363.1 hypothetical protein BKH40_05560 [Helicobacter sp. 11S02629-2]